MITLYRKRDKTSINGKFLGKQRIDKQVEMFSDWMAGKINKSDYFKAAFWKTAKEQLKIETHGKCAFCETPTKGGYYGDVEHFRPKNPVGGYWWLAYCY